MAAGIWEETRSKLLAAASAASAAVTDLVEASRGATGSNLTRANMVETLTQLNDALRLTLEADGHEDDAALLHALEEWMASHG